MNVYQPTLQAISLKQHGILTAVQSQQGMTRHCEVWVCLLASGVKLIGNVYQGHGKSKDSQAQLLGNWWGGFNGRDPFQFTR